MCIDCAERFDAHCAENGISAPLFSVLPEYE